MANKGVYSNYQRRRAIREKYSFDCREGVKKILADFECSPARGFYPKLQDILHNLCHLIAEKTAESAPRNGVLTENDVLNSINMIIPDNVKSRVFEKIRNSQRHLPYSIHCILHQNSEAFQNQFQESSVQSANEVSNDVIQQAVSVEDAMTRMLADVERTFKAQNPRTREFPGCVMPNNVPDLNVPDSTSREISTNEKQEISPHLPIVTNVIDDNIPYNMIPHSTSQTSPRTFTGISNISEEIDAHSMDIDNENQAINTSMINEEIEFTSMDAVDYLITQNDEISENNQMTANNYMMNETSGITSMDVDYPSNDDNKTFENENEMSLGRHMRNEDDYLYTNDENENNQMTEVNMLESLMNEEHVPNNSFCVHPSGAVEEHEQVTAMNEEVAVHENVSTVLTEVLESVGSREDNSDLNGFADNVYDDSCYREVRNESHEGNSMQEHDREFMGAFCNNTDNYKPADGRHPMEQGDIQSNETDSEIIRKSFFRDRWYFFLPFIPFM